jgi:hypothetical protein
MLWTIFVILLVLWGLGLMTGYTLEECTVFYSGYVAQPEG